MLFSKDETIREKYSHREVLLDVHPRNGRFDGRNGAGMLPQRESTKQSMTRHWHRKGSSGVPTKVRMPSSAPERKPWPNNGQSQVSRMLDPNISIEAFLLPDYILQNAFSNITYLCPQRPDMAEKLKAKRPPFSRQCVSPTLLSNIGMKAFRKSVF